MEQDQFFGGPFALSIINPYTGLRSYPLTGWKQLESQGVSLGRGHCTGGGEAEARVAWQPPVLAQRMAYEGPRWTRAVWGKPSPSSNGRWGARKEAEWQDTHVAPVLPERAPLEGPRSTAAIGATWVPCHTTFLEIATLCDVRWNADMVRKSPGGLGDEARRL